MQAPTNELSRYDDPRDAVAFQRVALGRRLWEKQRQIVASAATKRSTSVRGCHASGKTYAVAGSVLHHLATYPQGKAITLAPTLRQVKLFWEEVELARQHSQIDFPECSTTGLRITEENYGLGFSSARGINAQGFHGQDVLIITDESPGIQADVWDAIEGIRAGGRVRLVKLGNPTVPSGPFYDDFTRHRATTETITISAFDTPNLQNPATGRPFTIEELQALSKEELEFSPIPYLVSRYWVLDKFLRWGPTNPRYVSRVLGEFPTQSDYAVFDLAWIERARREPTEAELQRAQGNYIQVGIDVAAGGDAETTACARVNGIIIDRAAWSSADPPVARWLGNLKTNASYPLGLVVMDTVGVGHYLAIALAQSGFPVYGFKAGGEPMDKEQFVNAKAEAYFRLREMYKENYVSHLPGAIDEETEAQLSTIESRELLNGRVMIEPKEDARKRGVASPDRAEAEIMAFCRVVPRVQQVTFGGLEHISPV
jgi:Terminase large subunit, T4likevirus-type, N-terminal